MPKLQKHFAYKYKDQEHYKHVIVIPEETIKKLGWEAGIELQPTIDNNVLQLTPQRKSDIEKRQAVEGNPRKRIRKGR